jgi:1-acyl-sn-glycerol-3-phosphate acyltransferase
MRTLIYHKTNIVIKYPKNINIPNKFILLLNHTHINYDDYTHIFITLLLFPDHKYVIITNNSCNKFLKKFGFLFGQYIIKDDKSILYEDMSNFIKNNEKIVIIIFPEGNIKRTCSFKNYNINQKNINDFSIIEGRCFNYKKGAFIISLMNKIPILPAIFYSPMPNNNYTYFNKIYKIKHINHIGINIFNNNIDPKGNINDVEEYRLKMEKIFKKRYINVLLNANKYNI